MRRKLMLVFLGTLRLKPKIAFTCYHVVCFKLNSITRSCSLSGLLLKPSPLGDFFLSSGVLYSLYYCPYWFYWNAILCGQGSPVSNSSRSLPYCHLLCFHLTLLPREGVLWVGRSVLWQHKEQLWMRLLCSQFSNYYHNVPCSLYCQLEKTLLLSIRQLTV